MKYAIKVKSEKRRDSLLEELEEKGWSWQSGHNPTSSIMGLATIVTHYFILDTDYYNIGVSTKEKLEEDCVKIKDLACIPESESFVVKSTSKKQFKSILRHLAVRGYLWPNGKEVLKDFNPGNPWEEVETDTWIRVNRSSKKIHWTKEQDIRDDWSCTKSVYIELFDLPFVKDKSMRIKFTCWKTFKKAMKILEKEDFLWLNGKKPTEWIYKDWDKEDFSVTLIVWKKIPNGESKRLAWA